MESTQPHFLYTVQILSPHKTGRFLQRIIKKNRQNGGFIFSINENRIQQPILGTFVQDMVRLQMQVHV